MSQHYVLVIKRITPAKRNYQNCPHKQKVVEAILNGEDVTRLEYDKLPKAPSKPKQKTGPKPKQKKEENK